MAIDTALKRRAAAGVAFLPLTPGVTPTAIKNVFWRASVVWGYSLIVTVPVDGRPIHLLWEPAEFRFQLLWEVQPLTILNFEIPNLLLDWEERQDFNYTYTVPDKELLWSN